MKTTATKISLILLIGTVLFSCNAVKHVDEGEFLLTKNTIYENQEPTKKQETYKQLFQEPNIKLLGNPFRLHIYNFAKQKPDSVFEAWLNEKPGRKEKYEKLFSLKQVEALNEAYVDINEAIMEAGQAPTILEEDKTKASVKRLEAWYFNHGWFDAKARYEIIKGENKRAQVEYFIEANTAYIVDSISTQISSHDADSIYQKHKWNSFLKTGEQFDTDNFDLERQRITHLFRNNGLFHFEQEYISFIADTVGTEKKVNVELVIKDRDVSRNDSIKTIPFEVRSISEVNVVTDYSFRNEGLPLLHKDRYREVNLYSYEEPDIRSKAVTNAIFIKEGEVYRDEDRRLTYERLNELGIFQYPDIEYIDDPADTTGTKLIANIFLSQKKKYGAGVDLEAFRSDIQDFGIGIGGSFQIRNVFKGAEILELSGQGSIGASDDAATDEDSFFNISEVGADLKLRIPKIVFPANVDKVIPKSMSPFTVLKTGISTQRNIGLDKHNFTSAFTYLWEPSEIISHQLDVLNVQYVNNLREDRYFNVYQNSFRRLNEIAINHQSQIPSDYFTAENGQLIIPEGAENFINDINNGADFDLSPEEIDRARDIIERKNRLTEDNLIVASNFSYVKNTRSSLYDNDFTRFRAKFEMAGNTLSLLAPVLDFNKNENGNYELFGVAFSQYAKTELSIIKYWDLGHQTVVAVRAFGGIAIPYGNSNSIPFSRSFFAGGTNDNRGWQPYDLGPGSTGGPNEFNEANFKLAFNGEYRFNLFGDLFSAVFVDVGNIWHVADNVKNKDAVFDSFSDLSELAIGSGFGIRYDFDFLVVRFDLGFKTYDPANKDQKWFRDYNFGHVVYNIGINYPF